METYTLYQQYVYKTHRPKKKLPKNFNPLWQLQQTHSYNWINDEKSVTVRPLKIATNRND